MSTQWVQIGTSWTARQPGETLGQWAARAPAGEPAPSECDHETSWVSNGTPVKICTKCKGDESEEGCTERHEEAVEFWENELPPDP